MRHQLRVVAQGRAHTISPCPTPSKPTTHLGPLLAMDVIQLELPQFQGVLHVHGNTVTIDGPLPSVLEVGCRLALGTYGLNENNNEADIEDAVPESEWYTIVRLDDSNSMVELNRQPPQDDSMLDADMCIMTFPEFEPDLHRVTPLGLKHTIAAALQQYTAASEEDMRSFRWQLDMLQADSLPLRMDVTQEELDHAWSMQRDWLTGLRVAGERLKVLGSFNEQATVWMARWFKLNAMMSQIYTAARETRRLSNVRSEPAVPGISFHNPMGWSQTIESDEAATDDTLWLMDFFLKQASLQGVAKRAGIVYTQQTVLLKQWVGGGPNARRCGCPGPKGPCEELARYGAHPDDSVPMEDMADMDLDEVVASCGGPQRANVAARLRCVDHALESDVDYAVCSTATGAPLPEGSYPAEWSRATVNTRAWKPLPGRDGGPMTVWGWMMGFVDRSNHSEVWRRMLTGGWLRLSKTVVNVLTEVGDAAFPHLVPQRNWYAYANGWYDIDAQEFWSFRRPPPKPVTCAMNFINSDFDPRWLNVNPATIPAPGTDDILDTQYNPTGKDADSNVKTQNMFRVHMGRLFYVLNQFDQWGVLPVVTGYGATGKSSFAAAIADLLGHHNVGFLSSNVEAKYPLVGLVGRSAWMCLELRRHFQLPVELLLNMTTGEEVEVTQKNLDVRTVRWTAPGVMFGNELPDCFTRGDPGGAINRRVVAFEWDMPPQRNKPELQDAIHCNLGALLVKLTRMYREYAANNRTFDRSKLPARMRETEDKFKALTCPIDRFLKSDQFVELGDTRTRFKICKHILNVRPGSERSLGNTVESLTAQYEQSVQDNGLDEEHEDAVSAPEAMSAWCITVAELEKMYRQFCDENGVKGAPPITDPSHYLATVKTLMLAVTVDPMNPRKKIWYGLRPANREDAMHF